jgi:hypothetical protein
MKAIKIKNWCIENITPQSWSRIVLRVLPVLRSHGIELNQIENPSEEMELKDEIIEILDGAMNDIYKLNIDAEVMS